MGRRPIGKKPMTPAERQRRRRERLNREPPESRKRAAEMMVARESEEAVLEDAGKRARELVVSRPELEHIERQLRNIDAAALSFDHELAELSKAALVRIAERAAYLIGEINAEPSREDQKGTGWQPIHDARQAVSAARRGGIKIRKVEFVRTKG